MLSKSKETMMFKRFFLKVIPVTVLLLFCTNAYATVYFVSQQSTGSGTGLSYADRMGVGKHNGLSFEPGDTIYLVDKIVSKVIVPSSGKLNSPIIYKGDYPDHSGVIDRNGGDYGIYISQKDYIKIDGVEIVGFEKGAGIILSNGCDYITIINCKIHDGYNRGIHSTADVDGEWNSNVIIGGSAGNGNEIYNIGIDTAGMDVGLNRSKNIVVSYNHLYGKENNGIDGIMTENTYSAVFEYNKIHDHNYGAKGEDGIDIKNNSSDIIIRHNDIYNHTNQTGITVQNNSHDITIYDNYISNNKTGIAIFDHGIPIKHTPDGVEQENILISENTIYQNHLDGILVSEVGGDATNNVHIERNILSENGMKAQYSTSGVAIRIITGKSHKVLNNYFYKSRPYKNDYIQARYEVSDVDLNSNHYNWPSQVSKIYWDGNFRDLTTLKSKYSLEINGVENNTGYDANIIANDYKTNSISFDDSGIINSKTSMPPPVNIKVSSQ